MSNIRLDRDLVFLDVESNNVEGIISMMNTKMLEKGYVKDTYYASVMDREAVFPTGLQLKNIGVAIPHTFAEHVIQPSIAIARLKNCIEFHSMENPEKTIDVKIVFLLALEHLKLKILSPQRFMRFFQIENKCHNWFQPTMWVDFCSIPTTMNNSRF